MTKSKLRNRFFLFDIFFKNNSILRSEKNVQNISVNTLNKNEERIWANTSSKYDVSFLDKSQSHIQKK